MQVSHSLNFHGARGMEQGARDASESWEDLDLPSSRRWPETTMYKGIEAGEVLLRHLPNTSLASSRHP